MTKNVLRLPPPTAGFRLVDFWIACFGHGPGDRGCVATYVWKGNECQHRFMVEGTDEAPTRCPVCDEERDADAG